jgi:hypothetical protein
MCCSAASEIFRRRHLAQRCSKNTPTIGRTAARFNERTSSVMKRREFGGDLKGRTKKTARREGINLVSGSSSAPDQPGFFETASVPERILFQRVRKPESEIKASGS